MSGSWLGRPASASASSAPPAVAEKVAVTWPPAAGHLDLSHGSTTLVVGLRSAAGDAPIALSHLSLAVGGLPLRVYLDRTSLTLAPGRLVKVRALLAAASTARSWTLPARGNLRLTAVLHTRTVTTSLSDDVLFGTGQWRLEGRADAALQGLLRNVERFSGEVTSLTVDGYADSRPDATIGNKALSLYRARSVATWLKRHGVRAGAVRAVGEGATGFVASNATAAGRAANRRVVVHLSLSRAAAPALAGADRPVVLASLPQPPEAVAPPASRPAVGARRGTPVVAAAASGLAGVVALALAAVVVTRRRRRRRALLGAIARLPRWDRRRAGLERGAGRSA